MKRVSQLVSIGAVALLSLVLIAGCAEDDDQADADQAEESVTLSILEGSVDPNDRARWNALAEEVGVGLDFQPVPDGEQFEVLLRTKAATKELPDLVPYLNGTKWRSDIVPSENLVDLSDRPWAENVYDNIVPFISENGVIYAAPRGSLSTGGVFYNRELFAEERLEVPTTLEEFLSVAEALSETDATPLYIAGNTPWTLQLFALVGFPYDLREQPELMDRINSNQGTFDEAEHATRALEVLQTVEARGLINEDYLSATFPNAIQAMGSGEAGMFVMGTWFVSSLAADFGDQLSSIGFFPWPEEGETALPIWNPNTLGVASNSEHVDAAIKFVDFYMSQEGQEISAAFSAGPYFPPVRGVTIAVSDSSRVSTEIQEVLADAKYTFSTFPQVAAANLGDHGPFVQEMLLGSRTPVGVLEALTQRLRDNARADGVPGF